MKNLSKDILSFKRRKADLQRVIFAKDADLGIEAAEVVLANLQKAVNVVEAQVEGYDPPRNWLGCGRRYFYRRPCR